MVISVGAFSLLGETCGRPDGDLYVIFRSSHGRSGTKPLVTDGTSFYDILVDDCVIFRKIKCPDKLKPHMVEKAIKSFKSRYGIR